MSRVLSTEMIIGLPERSIDVIAPLPALCGALKGHPMSPTHRKLAAVLGTGNDPGALARTLQQALDELASAPPAPPKQLSREALAYCKRHGLTKEQFLARAARHTNRRGVR